MCEEEEEEEEEEVRMDRDCEGGSWVCKCRKVNGGQQLC